MNGMQVLRDCKDGALDAELEVGPGDAGKSDKSKRKESMLQAGIEPTFLSFRTPGAD
jgi:hypothetical protein